MSDEDETYFSGDEDDDFYYPDDEDLFLSLGRALHNDTHPMANLLRNRYGASRGGRRAPRSVFNDFARSIDELYPAGEFSGPVPRFQPRPSGEDEDDEEDYLGVAETYSPYYMPRKLKIGVKHPDPVVEAASLASVEPTDVWYELSLPSEIVNSGKLSALQLETITYACQQHEQILQNNERAGFLLGDGAGVGKGRTIAGLIYENYLKGRTRAIWVSVSNDLKYDAERDLKDIGADEFIKVHILSKLSYNRIASGVNGFISSGVIFSTYSALIGKTSQTSVPFKTRLEQLLEWCGPDFEGMIVFDESHRAKNLCPEKSRKSTKTGQTVQELQDKLPKARIVYASATGASEPRNMAYMTRLGMWGETSSFVDFKEFLNSVSKRGVSAMELVSMDMKLRGTYISRQLSFEGVTFRIEEVPLPPEFIAVYDESAEMWVRIKKAFDLAESLLQLDPMDLKKMWGQFWAAHQRFFKTLCISAKVSRAIEIARAAVAAGKCSVIGLQSTGEARTRGFLEKQDGELDEFVSSAKGVLENFVVKHFPTAEDEAHGSKRPAATQGPTVGVKRRGATLMRAPPVPVNPEHVRKMEATKKEILADIQSLGKRLPPNTLDQLIDELGGTDKVAEMTGRKGRVVRNDTNGLISYELREAGDSPLDALNLAEKKNFMDGKKLIAIISEAASSGISLQSDRRVPNQRRRVHITLELPWSADRAVQQFGRTHRCNQVNAPEYVFLISALAGEKRFASIVAKRLETLGALTQGDRRATEKRDFSQFNFDNKYGRLALDSSMKSMYQSQSPEAPTPEGFMDKASGALEGVGLIVASKENPNVKVLHKDCNSVRRFLNRILGLPVELQNQTFDFFTDTLNVIINRAKKNGTFDLGILDLGTGSEKVSRISVDKYVRKHATGVAVTELHALHGERGMNWDEALDLYMDLVKKDEGFYLARKDTSGKRNVLLAESYPDDKEKLFTVYHPNAGAQLKKMTLAQIETDYRQVTDAEAEPHWTQKYEASDTQCTHAFLRGRCRSAIMGYDCDVGLRKKKYFVLSGAVLCVWPRVEGVLSGEKTCSKMRVIRLCTVDGVRIIGALIPKSCVDPLKEALSKDAQEVKREDF